MTWRTARGGLHAAARAVLPGRLRAPSRIPALLAGAVAAFVLTACGVPPSGVVEAGEPAGRMPPPLALYFLVGDHLVSVPRSRPGRTDVVTAVRLAFAGPTDAEAVKVGTQLPRLASAPRVATDGRTVHVVLPEGVAPLSLLAEQQLACTVAGSMPYAPLAPSRWPGGTETGGAPSRVPERTSVHVVGDTWEVHLGSAACPLFGD